MLTVERYRDVGKWQMSMVDGKKRLTKKRARGWFAQKWKWKDTLVTMSSCCLASVTQETPRHNHIYSRQHQTLMKMTFIFAHGSSPFSPRAHFLLTMVLGNQYGNEPNEKRSQRALTGLANPPRMLYHVPPARRLNIYHVLPNLGFLNNRYINS